MAAGTGTLASAHALPAKRRFNFAGARATSQAVALPVLLVVSLNSSPAGLSLATTSPGGLLFIVVASGALSWLYFTLAGLALQRWCPHPSLSRTIWVALLFASTEMMRTTLMHLLALASGMDSEAEWFFRLIAAAATGLVFFGVLSTVLNDMVEYRRDYRRLAQQRIRLQTSLTTSGANLLATRAQTLSSVRSRLEEALVVTLAETRKAVPSDIAVVDELFRVADEVVRPLSHQLFDVPVRFEELTADITVPRARFSAVLKDVTKNPFRPGELGTLAALLAVPAIMLSASVPRAILIVAALGFVFLINWLGRRFLTPHLGGLRLGWRILFLSLVFALPAAALAIIVSIAVFSSSGGLALFGAYGVVIGMVMGWLVTFTSGLQDARNTMLAEAASINNELYRLNVRAQSQLWVAQKNLAITVHNDVQTTLIAAALHLQRAMESGTPAKDAMPDVRRILNQALDIAIGTVEERGPHDVLTRANEKWGGLIEASLAMSAPAAELLAHDSVGIRILEDLLVEFMTNSVKHGKAKTVAVELSAENDRTLKLVMTNNGSPIDAHRPSTGLGSRLLEALTLSHSVTDVPGGVRLTATIPIGAQAFAGADA